MKISIITINYNNLKGLIRTLKSVTEQSARTSIEYIVIDGASTDGGAELIQQHISEIDFAVSEPDNGVYNAMNKGVKRATGDYCLFLNSGDFLFAPDVIEKCIKELESGEDLIMGQLMTYPAGKIAWDNLKIPFTLFDFFTHGPIPHQGCFIKRSLFNDSLYDETLKIVSDWKFFMQKIVFEKCTYRIFKGIVSYFEEGGISSNRYACDQERDKVFRELLPPAVWLDYSRWENGKDFTESTYDLFYRDLRKNNMKCAKIVYTVSVMLVKFLSWGRPSLRFIRNYPFRWKS